VPFAAYGLSHRHRLARDSSFRSCHLDLDWHASSIEIITDSRRKCVHCAVYLRVMMVSSSERWICRSDSDDRTEQSGSMIISEERSEIISEIAEIAVSLVEISVSAL
jgi:hypothetical protein